MCAGGTFQAWAILPGGLQQVSGKCSQFCSQDGRNPLLLLAVHAAMQAEAWPQTPHTGGFLQVLYIRDPLINPHNGIFVTSENAPGSPERPGERRSVASRRLG